MKLHHTALDETTYLEVRARADAAGLTVSDWLRQIWARRSDGRVKPMSLERRSVQVRVDEHLAERIAAAAERAGVAVARWRRRAIEIELGLPF